MRTHTKETTWIQDPATTSSMLFRMPHLNNKQNKNTTQPSVDRITTTLSLVHQRKNKQTNKTSVQISPYMKLMQITGSTLLLLLLSCFSRAGLLVTPWTEAYQAPLSMGFSRQEYWSGVPLPSPESTVGGQKTKRRKNSTVKPGERRPQTQ